MDNKLRFVSVQCGLMALWFVAQNTLWILCTYKSTAVWQQERERF